MCNARVPDMPGAICGSGVIWYLWALRYVDLLHTWITSTNSRLPLASFVWAGRGGMASCQALCHLS